MENLSVTGFREPEIQDICFPGNRRFPGMSVRLSAKTEGRAQPPEIGASPESVIISIFFSANCGETRVFPSRTAGHSGKKAGFFPDKYKKLLLRYLSDSLHDQVF
ncbi:Uncharacterized protein dnm_027060 [Desulfonema magnum]|uniref:Uncharacterized protein n=1 Tax=Desulfonema magnum TaxID=45655 RepID=A0A975GMD3_9BACT|nr:Uncharacterized protein dnm_027060 [Desulfonema magnum]